MRRLLLVLTAVAAVILALAGPAAAGVCRAQDIARGDATNYLGTAVFRVTSNPDGTNVRGHAQFTVDAGNGRHNVYVGRATCLEVVGTEARIYGTITSGRGPTKQPYKAFTLTVDDNSPATTSPDLMYFEFFTSPLSSFCGFGGGGLLTRGYVVVKDAPVV